MHSDKNITKSKRRRLFKALVWIVVIVLANVVGFTLALQSSTIQTKLVQYLSIRLSTETGYQVTLNHIDIDWLDKATIEGLKVLDHHDQLMIDVAELTLDYKLSTLFRKNDVLIDEVILVNPDVQLITYTDSLLNITEFIKSIKKLTRRKEGTNNLFTIDHIILREGNLAFNTVYKDSLEDRFDHNHFKLSELNSTITDFSIRQDTISMAVRQLTAIDPITNLHVSEMNTDFEVSQSRMVFDNLLLKAGESVIKDSIVFTYNGMKNLNHFTDSVQISGRLDESILNSKELAVFVPYFKKIDEQYKFSGQFNGKVTDLSISNFQLGFGKGSYVAGRSYFSGLPDIEETFMDIRLTNSVIFENDLNKYVNIESFTEYNRFDNLRLEGNFTGYIQDFVATGKFYTNLGFIQTDINLKIAENPANTAYTGNILLENFELGSYLSQSKVGLVSMEGRISGRGVNVSNADFILDGEISQFELNNYSYSNIHVNAQFASEFFEGLISVDDPNLKLSSESFIDLRNKRNEVKIDGELEYINFQPLNLINQKSFLSTKVNLNIKGFQIDSIVGHIYLEDMKAGYRDQNMEVSRLLLNSEKRDSLRTLELVTDRVDMKLDGNFNFTTAVKDIKRLLHEYQLNLKNESDSLEAYYSALDLSQRDDYQINFNGNLRDINKLVNLFVPELKFSSGTKLSGYFQHGHSAIVALNLASDTITYAQNALINNELNFHASKVSDNREVLASMDFISDAQITADGATTDEFITSAVWDNHKIDFNVFLEQAAYDNIADLYGEISFLKDTTNVTFKPSNLRVLDKLWSIQENNKISFSNQEVHISNLSVFNEGEELRANGIISKDSSKQFTISATDLQLALVNPLINKELTGIINGDISVADVYDVPIIESDFIIRDFEVNNFLVGSVSSYSRWNNTSKLFDVNFYVEKDSLRAVHLTGTYNPFSTDNNLNLTTTLKKADLSVAEPFISTVFSEMQGSLSGEFTIRGSLRNPYLSGQGDVTNAQLRVNYLNTLYQFQGQWSLDSSAIRLNNVAVTDSNNKTAMLTGVFNHRGFRDFNMELKGTLTRSRTSIET